MWYNYVNEIIIKDQFSYSLRIEAKLVCDWRSSSIFHGGFEQPLEEVLSAQDEFDLQRMDDMDSIGFTKNHVTDHPVYC